MSLFSATPSIGDIVTPVKPIKTTATDYMLGGDAGIKPRTRGVVLNTSGWNSLEVEFDTGLWGSVRATVKAQDVRVVARGVGHDRFREQASRLRWARAGVAACLLCPIVFFIFRAWLSGDSQGDIIASLIDGAVQGILDLIAYAITSPLQALVYVLVLGGLSRFAFGR